MVIQWDFMVIQWDFIGIQWDMNGIYPPVICYIAIENGHRNSGFIMIYPLIAWWIFPYLCKCLPEGISSGSQTWLSGKTIPGLVNVCKTQWNISMLWENSLFRLGHFQVRKL